MNASPSVVAVFVVALLGSVACASSGSVVREYNGELVEGRYVSPEAYAAQLQGTIEEESGDLSAAARSYSLAVSHAPYEVAPLVRLASVACRLGDYETASRDFRKAENLDDSFAPLFVSKAQCLLLRNRTQDALVAAYRAAALEPFSDSSTSILRDCLNRSQRIEQGTSLSLAHRLLTHQVANETPDCRDACAKGTGFDDASCKRCVDGILLNSDATFVREIGTVARVGFGVLALRTALYGNCPSAMEQARLNLRTRPADLDSCLAQWMCSSSSDTTKPSCDVSTPTSVIARLVVSDLLLRMGEPVDPGSLLQPSEISVLEGDPVLIPLWKRQKERVGVR